MERNEDDEFLDLKLKIGWVNLHKKYPELQEAAILPCFVVLNSRHNPYKMKWLFFYLDFSGQLC